MLDLNDFFFFVQVVDRGGFTAAGRTLGVPKSTLSHRIQQLETSLGVRLLNRTSRRFGMTDAGAEFYRHATQMLQNAEEAEAAIQHRLREPTGTVRVTAGMATMQFALRDVMSDFLVKYPKVDLVAHATDRYVDVVGEHFDVAIRAHSDPLADSTLVRRALAPAPWFLFAGPRYLDEKGTPKSPEDLPKHSSLFVMRTGVSPTWQLHHSKAGKGDVKVSLTPRLMSDDMISLKQAAVDGLGIVALPGYVCGGELRSGVLRRVLPAWLAGDSTLTALMPYRRGVLPSVRALIEHVASELPKAISV